MPFPSISLWLVALGFVALVALAGTMRLARPLSSLGAIGAAVPTLASQLLATPTLTPSPQRTALVLPTGPMPTPTFLAYTAAQGDTWASIAAKLGLREEELLKANSLTASGPITTGQHVLLPRLGETAPTPPVASASSTITHTSTLPAITPTGAPSTATPVPPTPKPRALVHTVEGGDTLGSIAEKYDSTSEEIAQANKISLTTVLKLGQELVIPGKTAPAGTATRSGPGPTARTTITTIPTLIRAGTVTHKVQAGDTLGSLADKYNLTSSEIARANGIGLYTILSIGQELTIPGAVPTAALTPSALPSVTPSATATPTPRPSPFAPTPAFPYQAPQLLAPINSSEFSGAKANILLNWTAVGVLSERESYVLRVWRSEHDAEPLREVWLRTTSWRVPAELYPKGASLRSFLWQVVVMSRAAEGEPGIAISPASPMRQFFWQ
jgi:LysM repeat protein